MNKNYLLIFGMIALVGSAWIAHAEEGRKVTLQWKPLPKAMKYQVEISKSNRMQPTFMKKVAAQPKVVVTLPPGVYYFRIRSLDQNKSLGAWSDTQGFVVNTRAPQLIAPRDNEKLAELIGDGAMGFEWSEQVSGTVYRIEIRDQSGVVNKRSVDQNTFQWKPSSAGVYLWRVGYETQAGGVEWSKYRRFTVSAKAKGVWTRFGKTKVVHQYRKIKLLSFSVAGLVLFQASGGSSYSGQFDWSPLVAISPYFSLGIKIGVFPLLAVDNSTTIVWENTGLISYKPAGLEPFVFELGMGVQTWVRYDSYLVVQFQTAYELKNPWLSILDRLHLSYSVVSLTDDLSHVIKLGARLSFD